MNDGPPTLTDADEATARIGLTDPALAYDYFKSMVSLSVATLGGILALAGSVFGAQIAPWQMGAAALPVAMSGLIALQGQTDIVQLIHGVKPPLDSSRTALRWAPRLYGLGLGLFLAALLLAFLAPDVAARLR